jgi:DNA-nicking Smr family endonuclease
MKPRKPSVSCRSFEDLKVLLDHQVLPLPIAPEFASEQIEVDQSPEPEETLLTKAMEGVIPIQRGNYVERICQAGLPEGTREGEDADTLSKLADLVKYGKGFNVSDTPEYIEGTGYHVNPAVARRLHQGDYSIQAHVDLHGYNVEAAKEMFEKFLKWAAFTGKRGVLIVHGRGLCSPSEPVLKKKVEEWLTRGPWRKWVVAYSSARIYDGGAGATYVLLRERPISKRFKLGKLKVEKARGCM